MTIQRIATAKNHKDSIFTAKNKIKEREREIDPPGQDMEGHGSALSGKEKKIKKPDLICRRNP